MITTTLWISYKGKKYRAVAKYDDIVAAIGEMQRYIEHHTVKGDKVKLVCSKRD